MANEPAGDAAMRDRPRLERRVATGGGGGGVRDQPARFRAELDLASAGALTAGLLPAPTFEPGGWAVAAWAVAAAMRAVVTRSERVLMVRIGVPIATEKKTTIFTGTVVQQNAETAGGPSGK